jgi:hypothetical protein
MLTIVAAQHPKGMRTIKYRLCVYVIALLLIDFIVNSVIDDTCCQLLTLNCASCWIIYKRWLGNKLEEPAVANKYCSSACAKGLRIITKTAVSAIWRTVIRIMHVPNMKPRPQPLHQPFGTGFRYWFIGYVTSAVFSRQGNKGFVTGHLPRQVRLTEGVIRWLHDIMHASALC